MNEPIWDLDQGKSASYMRKMFQKTNFDAEGILYINNSYDTLFQPVNIITGTETLEYFDEFVRLWMKQGGEDITNEVNLFVQEKEQN